MDIRLRNKGYENYLMEQLRTRDFSSFMLFVGQKGSGKFDTAMHFARNAICEEGTDCSGCANCNLFNSGNHPDVMTIGGEERIKIAEIRELNQKLNLKPYQAEHKIAVIRNSHLMTDESANAMLKLLEEPPGKSIIILTAEDKTLLPETIVSRSQLVDFGASENSQINEEYLTDAKEILETKSLIEKFKIAEKYGKDRGLAGGLLDGAETILRQGLLSQKGNDMDLISQLELLAKTRQYLNRNLSTRFVLENLILGEA